MSSSSYKNTITLSSNSSEIQVSASTIAPKDEVMLQPHHISSLEDSPSYHVFKESDSVAHKFVACCACCHSMEMSPHHTISTFYTYHQTDNLQQIKATTADNVIMSITSTVNWRIVDVYTVARLAAETMNSAGSVQRGGQLQDISKLRKDILKQAEASLAAFIGQVNYSGNFQLAAAIQKKGGTDASLGLSVEGVRYTGDLNNPMFNRDGIKNAVEHANEITQTYGVRIISINIITADLVDNQLERALASGAVSAAEAPQCDGCVKLLKQPSNPTGSVVVVECRGGSDKGADGHRRDTIPICNALIKKGWKAYPIFYSDTDYNKVFTEVSKANAYICRVNPGKYDGVTQSKLETFLYDLAGMGIVAMSHPQVMKKMGAKDALVKIKDLSCGMADTYAYYDIPSFKENFPKTIATGVRVLKQNRGSQGEGIWVCKVKDGGSSHVSGSTMLHLQEAVDNHVEEKTLDDFMKFCEQYINGEDGQLIDQRFLPRIVEGEVRVNMIYDKPTEIVHKKPAEGGISATLASGAKYVSYKPDDPMFKVLMDNFINKDLPKIMSAIGMDKEPIPLIWTSDFILGDKDSKGNDTYFVGEFNCSCVGITQQLHLTDAVADACIRIINLASKNKDGAAAPVISAYRAIN